MGFDISYRTTEQLSPKLQQEVIATAKVLYENHSWVRLYGPTLSDEGGYLVGDSRLSPTVDEEDAKDCRSDGKPDGTCLDLLDALVHLSRMYQVDWAIEHDHSEGQELEIVDGKPTEETLSFFEGMDEFLTETGDDGFEMPDDAY
jgi:hypothetical protein